MADKWGGLAAPWVASFGHAKSTFGIPQVPANSSAKLTTDRFLEALRIVAVIRDSGTDGIESIAQIARSWISPTDLTYKVGRGNNRHL